MAFSVMEGLMNRFAGQLIGALMTIALILALAWVCVKLALALAGCFV